MLMYSGSIAKQKEDKGYLENIFPISFSPKRVTHKIRLLLHFAPFVKV